MRLLFAGSADGTISVIDTAKAVSNTPIRSPSSKWSILSLSTNSLGTLVLASSGPVLRSVIQGHRAVRQTREKHPGAYLKRTWGTGEGGEDVEAGVRMSERKLGRTGAAVGLAVPAGCGRLRNARRLLREVSRALPPLHQVVSPPFIPSVVCPQTSKEMSSCPPCSPETPSKY